MTPKKKTKTTPKKAPAKKVPTPSVSKPKIEQLPEMTNASMVEDKVREIVNFLNK